MTDDPPLLSAARHDCYELLCQLLERGENPNQTNKFGETALILAAQRGFEKGVERLLQAGADPLQMGGDYSIMRHHAVGFANKQSHFNIIKKLLESIELNTAEKIGWYRCCAGDNGYTSLLDDALLKLENVYGQPTLVESLPPLIQAIYRNDFPAFKELLSKGADPHEPLGNGLAALHQAIRFHRHDMFDVLVEHKVDINQRASSNYCSPLFIAVKVQNHYAYRQLIQRGAKDLPTSEHHTALFAAVYLNEMPLIKELVARGSDLHQYARDPNFTLVYCAARYGHLDVLKYLLSLGLKPDMKPKGFHWPSFDMFPGHPLTALSAAVKNCDVEAVELLLKAGADPNRKSAGIPTLFFASPSYRFPESETVDYHTLIENYCIIIDLLIAHGADVHLKSHDGTFFLTQCILSGQEEIAIHLLKSGACGAIRDKNGKFPIETARALNQCHLMSYLEEEIKKMTPLEMQEAFIQNHLHPVLKSWGYQNHQETWWLDKGDFVRVIHLQNYPWNTQANIDFCFYLGTAPKGLLEYTYFDMSDPLPEAAFLPDSRQKHPYKNSIGYSITDKTDFAEFIHEMRIDFEQLRETL